MEFLPDEVFFLIFRYLHKFDILCAFGNLNQRFRRITAPYLYEIDITNENTPLSYRQLLDFLAEILHLRSKQIHSVKLSCTDPQSQLFYQHINHLTNLKSVTLYSNNYYLPSYSVRENEYLNGILQLKCVSELTVHSHAYTILQTIANYARQTLTTLTLLNLKHSPNFDNVSEMPYVKRLTINLVHMKQVAQIFQIMINLEQLRLIWYSTYQTVGHFVYPLIQNANPPFETNDFHLLQVPRTLEELHLKIEYLSLDNLKSFLHQFHNEQLKSLILIVNDTDSEFTNFDIFQNLTNNFTCLQTFEYCIRTKHRPDSRFLNVEQLSDSTYRFYTLPRPQSSPFKTITFNQQVTTKSCLNSLENLARVLFDEILEVYSERYPMLDLTDDKIKFINLKEIRIIKKIESFHHSMDQCLSKIIRMSPNLHTLYINSCSTKKIVGHLKNILRKKFKSHLNLQCRLNSSNFGDYHTEFFYEVSKILPNLKSITFPCVAHFMYQHGTTLIDLIEDLRSYFSSLAHIRLEFDGRYTNCQQTLEIYTKELSERHDTVGYTVISDRYSRICLDICL